MRALNSCPVHATNEAQTRELAPFLLPISPYSDGLWHFQNTKFSCHCAEQKLKCYTNIKVKVCPCLSLAEVHVCAKL